MNWLSRPNHVFLSAVAILSACLPCLIHGQEQRKDDPERRLIVSNPRAMPRPTLRGASRFVSAATTANIGAKIANIRFPSTKQVVGPLYPDTFSGKATPSDVDVADVASDFSGGLSGSRSDTLSAVSEDPADSMKDTVPKAPLQGILERPLDFAYARVENSPLLPVRTISKNGIAVPPPFEIPTASDGVPKTLLQAVLQPPLGSAHTRVPEASLSPASILTKSNHEVLPPPLLEVAKAAAETMQNPVSTAPLPKSPEATLGSPYARVSKTPSTPASTRTKSSNEVAAPAFMPSKASQTRQQVVTAGFSFATAWSDVSCLVRYHCLSSKMTGHWMQIMASVAKLTWIDGLFGVITMFHYVAGLAIHRVVDIRMRQCGRQTSCSALAPFVCALFMAADFFHCMFGRWSVLFLSLGFGLINGVASRVCGAMVGMISGHAHQISNAIVDQCMRRPVGGNVKRSVTVMFSFAAGIAACSVATFQLGLGLPTYHSVMGVMFAALMIWNDWPLKPWRCTAPRQVEMKACSPKGYPQTARLYPDKSTLPVQSIANG